MPRAIDTVFAAAFSCWHGFQYVRVTPTGRTGFTGGLDAIVGLEIHTNMTATGHLSFGGEGDPDAEEAAVVLTHINQMTLQSQRTNVGAYMPTDCEWRTLPKPVRPANLRSPRIKLCSGAAAMVLPAAPSRLCAKLLACRSDAREAWLDGRRARRLRASSDEL